MVILRNEEKTMFPSLKEGYALQRGSEKCIVYPFAQGSGEIYYVVNEPAGRILEHCNGKTEINDIAKILSLHYKDDFNTTLKVVNSYLNENDIFVDIFSQSTPTYPKITGKWDIQAPNHVSIELTYSCNFRCRHCYMDSSPKRDEFLDSKKLFQVLESLANYGVPIVELTGGDPLVHPEFLSIFERCVELFPLVSVITNGYALTKDHLIKVNKFKKHIAFQVDLNGDNPEYVDWFSNKKGAFEHAKNAIKLLSEEGFFTRVAMTLTPKNIDQMYNTVALAKKLGASTFIISPVIPMGRGENSKLTPDFVYKPENIRKIEHYIEKIEEEFGNFIFKSSEFPGKKVNCGAGSRVICITPSGETKMCVMSSPHELSFGNVNDEDIDTILSRINALNLYSAELPSQEICGNCQYVEYCGYCLARGLQKYHEVGKTCSWVKLPKIASSLKEAKKIGKSSS
jgi:radical SAM protein with 4Fe4S-binding SPASM domain